jgi:flagellar basal-body rod protein FlgC
MDYLQSFAVSAAGMAVERARVEVAAMNLANANTVTAPDVRPYQPLRVLARAGASFADLVGERQAAAALPAVSIEPASTPPRLVYEPGHPLADARGFVAHAGVDPATEMVTLMSALRSYEANVAAMNMARVLALKTLDIGRAG